MILLDKINRSEGIFKTPELVVTSNDRYCKLQLDCLEWNFDFSPIIFGFERSFNNGKTWEHWCSATTQSGFRDKNNKLPGLTVPLYGGDEFLIRASLNQKRQISIGLIGETIAGTRDVLLAGEHHSWAAVGRKNEASVGSATSLNVTLNSTVAGNFIALGSSIWHSGGASTCVVSDGPNGNYIQSFYTTAGDPAAGLYYIANNAGGNLTINANPTPDNSDFSIFVEEFSGGDTSSPESGTAVTNSGTGTTASTGATVETDANCLILAIMDYDKIGSITENAGSEGFTLSGENQLPSDYGQPGSFVYKIVTGTPHPSHSWSLGASGPWVCGIAAFKPFVSIDSSIITPMINQNRNLPYSRMMKPKVVAY